MTLFHEIIECSSKPILIITMKDTGFHKTHEEMTEYLYAHPTLLPYRYVFVLTNRCNLKCPFCFQTRYTQTDYMTIKDWLFLVDQLPDYARVTLTGGEPFVYPGFQEIFTYVAERRPCNVITNGLLLSDAVNNLLLSYKNFKVLSVSIDDIGNKSRQFTKSQWGRLVENIKRFKVLKDELEHECIIDIKTTILDENADRLYEIYKFCIEELQCDSHVFQLLKGSPIQHADRAYSIDDIVSPAKADCYQNWEVVHDQLEKVRDSCSNIPGKVFIHPKTSSFDSDKTFKIPDFLNLPDFSTEEVQPCKFPWSSVHVNCDGNLFPCLAVSIGNIRTHSLIEIIQCEKNGQFRDLIESRGALPACHRCGWLRPAPDKDGDV